MPRKYQPLADYHAAQSGDSLTLTLREIEQPVREDLPAGARTRLWSSKPFPRAAPSWGWRSVGWRVVAVDLRRQMVTFVRQGRREPP